MADIVETRLEAATTAVPGRFIVSGAQFQLVTDAAASFGGPGTAASANDLLVAALLTCAINIFRGSTEPDLPTPRTVVAQARLWRTSDDPGLGRLDLDLQVGGVDQAGAERLIAAYAQTCRVYKTLRSVIPITVTARPL
jgi:organic hydroperoxide reductase OsmC/OhrA